MSVDDAVIYWVLDVCNEETGVLLGQQTETWISNPVLTSTPSCSLIIYKQPHTYAYRNSNKWNFINFIEINMLCFVQKKQFCKGVNDLCLSTLIY